MRYRMMDENFDYVFGQGSADFLIDSAKAVAQSILTRLRLLQGEWFMNSAAGVPYSSQVLGTGTAATRDIAIRSCIMQTRGVTQLLTYTSNFDPRTRKFSVTAAVMTEFSKDPVPISTEVTP